MICLRAGQLRFEYRSMRLQAWIWRDSLWKKYVGLFVCLCWWFITGDWFACKFAVWRSAMPDFTLFEHSVQWTREMSIDGGNRKWCWRYRYPCKIFKPHDIPIWGHSCWLRNLYTGHIVRLSAFSNILLRARSYLAVYFVLCRLRQLTRCGMRPRSTAAHVTTDFPDTTAASVPVSLAMIPSPMWVMISHQALALVDDYNICSHKNICH